MAGVVNICIDGAGRGGGGGWKEVKVCLPRNRLRTRRILVSKPPVLSPLLLKEPEL